MIKILLTGQPKVGKTTLIKNVIEHMNLEQCGFLTQRMPDRKGISQGFQVNNFKGESEVLAHKSKINSDLVVGNNNKVDIEVADVFLVNEIQKVFDNNQCILILDEIGRMQAFSQKFLEAARRVVNSEVPMLGSIVFEDEPWAREFKNNKNVLVLNVTQLNREELLLPLVAIFNSISSFRKLPKEKQKIARDMIYQYLREGKYLQVKKFCTNALNYILENRIKKGGEDSIIVTYIVKGTHLEHMVKHDKDINSYSCDCDLFKGLNQYKGMSGECAHIQSVKLFTGK